MHTMLQRFVLLLLLLLFAGMAPAIAQGSYQVETRPVRGFMPNMDLLSSPVDHVDPVSRKIHLEIPLASLPQGPGGSGFGLNLVYDTHIWSLEPEIFYPPFPYDNDPPARGYTLRPENGDGWNFNIDNLGVDYEEHAQGYEDPNCGNGLGRMYRIRVRLLDGSSHTMQLKGWGTELADGYNGDGFFPVDPGGRHYCGTSFLQMATGWLTYFSNDGSHLKLEIYADGSGNWNTQQAWHLYFPDGRKILFGGNLTEIFDANGNRTRVGYSCFDPPPEGNCTQLYKTVLDDTGHEILIVGATVTTQGPSGPMTWTLDWGLYELGNDGRQYLMTVEGGQPPWIPTEIITRPLYHVVGMLKSIQLPLAPPVPGNQTPPVWNSYAFGYSDDDDDGYGELKTVRTPTGATFNYAYQLDGSVVASESIAHRNTVFERRVTVPGQSDLVWTYLGAPTQEANRVRVTNPDQSSSLYWFTPPASYRDTSIVNNTDVGPVVYRIDEPNGNVRKRLWSQNRVFPSNPYSNSFIQNPWVKRETVTMGDASGTPTLTAVTDRSIDKNGNLLQQTEYDWVPYNASAPETGTTPKRTSLFTYYADVPAATSITDDSEAYWNSHFSPLSPGQPRRLDAVRRKEVRDTTGTIVALTEFDYDEWYSSGNVTAEKHWDSVKSASPPGLGQLNPSNSQVLNRLYDTFGNLIELNGAQVRTHIDYDSSGSFPEYVYYAYQLPEERSWQYHWDFPSGTLEWKKDLDNVIQTTYGYDAVGRQILINEADVRKTETFFDDPNRKVTVWKDLVSYNDKKLEVETQYDELGRVTLMRTKEPGNAQGINVKSTYYPQENRTVQSSPYRTTSDATLEWTCTQTDSSKRLVAVAVFKGDAEPSDCEGPSNRTGITRTEYDANQTKITDPAGKVRREMRNALGELAEVSEDPGGLNYPTFYNYDGLGNLKQVIQDVQTRTFNYSSLGRLLSAMNPENGEISYTYYDNGTLYTRTQAGITATFGYDELQRIETKTYSDGTPSVTYQYYLDGAGSPKVGQLQSVSSSVASSQNDSYDALGRVTSSSHTINGDPTIRNFEYTYWLNNSVKTVRNPSNRLIQYDVDDAGRTVKVRSDAKTYADLTVTSLPDTPPYTPDGRIIRMKLGNDLWETRDYQTPGLPTLFKLGTSESGNEKLQLEYYFSGTNNNGNLQTQVIRQPGKVWTQNFNYDGVNRLTSASEDAISGATGWIRTYGYDQYGNRWIASSPSILSTDPHEPIAQSNFNAANNHISVANSIVDPLTGNQTYFAPWSLEYDAENRQKTVTSPNNGSGTFAYDGDGRRVKKSWTPYGGNPTSTYYIYNALGQLAAEYSTQTPGPGTSYIHTDMLGSTRMVTDSTGATLECYDYLPFGRMLSDGVNGRNTGCYPPNPDSVISSNLPQKFTGKERDAETRLDYFQARYFSAVQGRFTSADPLEIATLQRDEIAEKSIDPQNWNKYAYVSNNPLAYVDPTGRSGVRVNDPFLGNWAKEVRELQKEYASATGIGKVWAGIKLAFKESEQVPTPTAMSYAGGAALAKSGQALEGSAQVFTGLARNSGKVLEGVAEGVAYRRPDLLGVSATLGELLGEVKDVARLALTGQMRDAFKAAEKAGVGLYLFVGEKTKFTKPLLDQIRQQGARVYRNIEGEWLDVTGDLFKE